MVNRTSVITTHDGDDIVAACRPDLGGHAQYFEVSSDDLAAVLQADVASLQQSPRVTQFVATALLTQWSQDHLRPTPEDRKGMKEAEKGKGKGTGSESALWNSSPSTWVMTSSMPLWTQIPTTIPRKARQAL